MTPGTRLGPFEIIAPLGAGGMGEVYRATDTKLGRDVAIKVLPEEFFEDRDRVARFEREAKTLAALSHPGIAVVHSFEQIEGRPVLVMELLEGETLRSRLEGGPLPLRKAVDWGLQMARALAAAHMRGVIHRDLKPENLFVTRDGVVKILDFGLARQVAPASALTQSPTVTPGTGPGVVLGTVGYMAPEQVRGQPADNRSDIFALGCILYELVSGRRAFRKETAAETMTAILKEEPPELTPRASSSSSAPAGLDRLVRHCLEKDPDERFQSARDVAFDLEALSQASGAGAAKGYPALSGAARRAAGLVVVFVAGAGLVLILRKPATLAATFRQLTFQSGVILSARFAPDGQTVVYGAAWQGRPTEVFASRPEAPESRSLGLSNADVVSVSRAGEMALMLSPVSFPGFRREGVLARAPLAGGAPRSLLDRVEWADWRPDGESLAIVRPDGGGARLEFPTGRVLYRTSGWISHPRISPDGRLVAFCDHPLTGDDRGDVAVVGEAAPKRTLAGGFTTVQGLAFGPSGDEIWFTGAPGGAARSLHAVTLAGRLRLILRVPGELTLHDVDRSGRALLTRDLNRQVVMCLAPGETQERDLSLLDYSRAMGISRDGKTVLIDETGEGGGPKYSSYVRRTDGSPAVRLTEGSAEDLSADGSWAMVGSSGEPRQLVAVPTGTGEPHELTRDRINHVRGLWLGGTRRFCFIGNEPGRPARLWVQEVGGLPRAISAEGVSLLQIAASADGRTIAAAHAPGQGVLLYPVDGGEPRRIPGVEADERPAGWAESDRAVYVVKPGFTARVDRVDAATGRREHVRDVGGGDPTGRLGPFGRVQMTPDGRAYVYSFARILSELYLVEGLR